MFHANPFGSARAPDAASASDSPSVSIDSYTSASKAVSAVGQDAVMRLEGPQV